MDDEQRYTLDLQGVLHIPHALSAAELASCRAAADRIVALEAAGGLPEGCELEVVGDGSVGSHYDKVFSIEPALVTIHTHPSAPHRCL